MAAFDGWSHKAPQEGEHQGSNVGAIDISVRHDDEFVVAEFRGVKSAFIADVVAHARTERTNHGLNLLILEHLGHVVHLALHVQDFSTQGQDGLRSAVSSGLGRTAGGIALNEVDFTLFGLARLAICEFTWQAAALEDTLAASQITSFSRSLPGFGGQNGFVNNEFADRRVLLKELVEFLVDDGLDDAGDLAAHQFVLGLGGKRGIRVLHADDGCQAFSNVIAGQTVVLQEFLLLRIAVDAAGQRCSEARHVRTAVFVSNDVRVAIDALAEGIGPLECQFNRHRALFDVFLTRDEDGVGVEGLSASIDLFHEF